jgi:hemerythrin-like domain-containing protein
LTETRARLSEVMGGDHHDLDDRWERLQGTPESERAARRELFDAFRADLLHHIEIEEDLLFPQMLNQDASLRGLVERLLEEHREIEETLERLAREIDTGSKAVDDLAFELKNILGEHNAREESSVYPWLDDHLAPAQVLEAVGRLGPRDSHEPSNQSLPRR